LKSLIKNITKILVSIILLNIGLHAQKDTTVTADTINSSNIFEMHKSPWGAVARSAVIPGWGQIYNESYWKAPVVWGVMGWFVYVWIDNNNKYKDYKNLYIQYGDNSLYDYKRARDFYRDQRDQFAIYLVLTYFLNLVDAYVDAHLFDFSVDENYITGQKMFNLRVNF
jgi:hypothetical protein